MLSTASVSPDDGEADSLLCAFLENTVSFQAGDSASAASLTPFPLSFRELELFTCSFCPKHFIGKTNPHVLFPASARGELEASAFVSAVVRVSGSFIICACRRFCLYTCM